jgi:hypothetical protein
MTKLQHEFQLTLLVASIEHKQAERPDTALYPSGVERDPMRVADRVGHRKAVAHESHDRG